MNPDDDLLAAMNEGLRQRAEQKAAQQAAYQEQLRKVREEGRRPRVPIQLHKREDGCTRVQYSDGTFSAWKPPQPSMFRDENPTPSPNYFDGTMPREYSFTAHDTPRAGQPWSSPDSDPLQDMRDWVDQARQAQERVKRYQREFQQGFPETPPQTRHDERSYWGNCGCGRNDPHLKSDCNRPSMKFEPLPEPEMMTIEFVTANKGVMRATVNKVTLVGETNDGIPRPVSVLHNPDGIKTIYGMKHYREGALVTVYSKGAEGR